MKKFLRRLRGLIGTGLTWAVGWGAVFTVLSGILGNPPIQLGVAALVGLAYGFVAGGSFAVILSIAERRRTLDQLSLKRVALWGGIGAAALVLFAATRLIGAGIPLDQLVAPLLGRLGFVGLLGAGSASGSVAIARRRTTKLIEGDDEALPALEGE